MRGPIARSTITTSAVLWFRLVIQAGTLLMVTRGLGAHDFGIFAGLTALAVTIGALSSFGTHFVLLRDAARAGGGRADTISYAVPTTLLLGGLLFLLYLSVVALVYAPQLAWWRVAAMLGMAEILLQPLINLPACELQGRGRIVTGLALQLAPLALRMLSIIALSLIHVDDLLWSYTLAYLASSLLVLVLLGASRQRLLGTLDHLRLPRRREVHEAWAFGAIGVSGIAPAELDKSLALRLLPPEAAGIYSAGSRVIGALTLPVTAMILSALPRLFRIDPREARGSKPLLIILHGTAAIYGVALGMALAWFAPTIGALFGGQFAAMPALLSYLAWIVPGITLRITAGSTLMALGRPWARVGTEIAGVIVLAILALALAPQLDMRGMALAAISMEWFMALLGMTLIALSTASTHRSETH